MSSSKTYLHEQHLVQPFKIKNTLPHSNFQIDKNKHTNNKDALAKIKIDQNQSIFNKNYKNIFMTFSKIHQKFKLKTRTLFLAIELYERYKINKEDKKQIIPSNYLSIICIFIAIKYEQIYPPKITYILAFLKIAHNFCEYLKYQKSFLQFFNFNLHMKTGKDFIDQQIQFQTLYKNLSIYLLQISFYQIQIRKRYSTDIICKSIAYVLTHNFLETRYKDNNVLQLIKKCAKQIMIARSNHFDNQSQIYKKYCQETYNRVANKPIVYLKQ